MRVFFLCFCLVGILVMPVAAPAWEGTVVRVSDGDTILVEREGRGGEKEQVRVRLHGIDAPECAGRGWDSQPYCKAAGRFLTELLSSGKVAVMDMGVDKYGRTIGGIISLPDGAVAQEELLKAGLVWVYTKYCRDCRQWRELETEARESGAGLWSDTDPVPPWEWRRRGREKTAAASAR